MQIRQAWIFRFPWFWCSCHVVGFLSGDASYHDPNVSRKTRVRDQPDDFNGYGYFFVRLTLQGDKERYIVWDRVQVTTLAREGFPDDGGFEKRK